MQKRLLLVSGSVWEAELFIKRFSQNQVIAWESEKDYLYAQPRLFQDIQTIFVVTGFDGSTAKRAVESTLQHFSGIDYVIGHGFCSGLVKHAQAGDVVMMKELVLASNHTQLQMDQSILFPHTPHPLWTKVLALKKSFQSEIEKAAVYASSSMEAMDPICGVWYKVLQESQTPFVFIKSLLDGGNELGFEYCRWLDHSGAWDQSKIIKNALRKPIEWFAWNAVRKNHAQKLIAKSHDMIFQAIEQMKQPQDFQKTA